MASSTPASLEVQGRREIPGCVPLDLRAYIGNRPNATTACSVTSTGLPISVSFWSARPPVLSQISVHCPGLGLDDLSLVPKVISSDGDLVVLRVPRDPLALINQRHSDYFVYRMRRQRPKLELLPNPRPALFGDDEIAILSCDDDKYVVAGLKIMPFREYTFELHLYRSTDGKPGSWTSQLVSVEEPLRDIVCPLPDNVERMMYHMTDKVIILGGDQGTIGWVDLWRGILLCDVLSEEPKLRDVPLPLPAKGNWTNFLNCCPHFYRNITVNQRKNTIKYVEMEITLPVKVLMFSPSKDPDSYYEWVLPRPEPKSCSLLPGTWTATTYSMPIPVTSWGDWRHDNSICLADLEIPVEGSRHYQLMCKLISRSGCKQQEATEASSSLGYLSMAYPTLMVDDDDDDNVVVYLVSKVGCMQAVVAVDMRASTLQELAKLDTKRHVNFRRCFLASRTSKHFKTTGSKASFGQAEEHMQNPAS